MKYRTPCTPWLPVLALVCALAACGGDIRMTHEQQGAAADAAATPPPESPPTSLTAPAAPTLSMLPQSAKTLHFSWTDGPGKNRYELLEDPDGQSGYQPVATLAADATAYDHTVFLPERLNARYAVQACNDSGCSAWSNAVQSGPLASAIGHLKASNADASDQFGSAVAISADGSTLAIGSPLEDSDTASDPSSNAASDSGAVYVFTRQGSSWQQQAYLKASNAGAGDRFGASLALSADGNTLVVGAPLEDSAARGINGNQISNSGTDHGAAYVFTRQGEAWAQQAYVKPSNAGGLFGISVALAGDGRTLAVGAINESSISTGINNGQDLNGGAPASGAVYVFSRGDNPDGWTQEAYVKASNTTQDDRFGSQVALSANGNTLAVGAPFEDQASPEYWGNLGTGAAYVYVRSGGVWSHQALLRAATPTLRSQFGASLTLSADGRTLAVGSPLEDSDAAGTPNAAFDSGAVYLFTSDGNAWTQQAILKAANADTFDRFGTSVALSPDGQRIAVGAPQESGPSSGFGGDGSVNGSTNSGAVYLFARDGLAWTQQQYLKAPNAASNQQFGASVAFGGDGAAQSHTLVVGAGFESSAALSSGAAYLY